MEINRSLSTQVHRHRRVSWQRSYRSYADVVRGIPGPRPRMNPRLPNTLQSRGINDDVVELIDLTREQRAGPTFNRQFHSEVTSANGEAGVLLEAENVLTQAEAPLGSQRSHTPLVTASPSSSSSDLDDNVVLPTRKPCLSPVHYSPPENTEKPVSIRDVDPGPSPRLRSVTASKPVSSKSKRRRRKRFPRAVIDQLRRYCYVVMKMLDISKISEFRRAKKIEKKAESRKESLSTMTLRPRKPKPSQ